MFSCTNLCALHEFTIYRLIKHRGVSGALGFELQEQLGMELGSCVRAAGALNVMSNLSSPSPQISLKIDVIL